MRKGKKRNSSGKQEGKRILADLGVDGMKY
jgi:hypothetical protein